MITNTFQSGLKIQIMNRDLNQKRLPTLETAFFLHFMTKIIFTRYLSLIG